ncbi:MAG: serine/threonine-protein phosphatase [Chloroflexi bacterium]|nr:serine/threonine-protein phosphatase [Chloroflexota bacterium]
MHLRHAARTDVGKTRDHNEDSYGMEAGGERAASGALFVVCDGIGGYASGEVASDLAVKTIIDRFYAAVEQPPDAALSAAFEEANRVVFQQGGGKMGTTGVAALFRDDAVVLANAGDCRAYLVRGGKIRQITHDHSFVAEQVAAGMLTEEQARESSYRHIITRAIGHRSDLEVDVFREPLLQSDILVLCSDGLHSQVEPNEIALAVTKVSLDDACRALVKLANDRGGPDNITVIAVEVTELTFTPDRPYGQQEEPPGSLARTARLETPETTPTGTARLETAEPQTVYGPAPLVDRRKGSDRRGSAAGAVDRRAAPVAPVVPPAPRPASNPARSFIFWMIGLLLIAAIIFGAYWVVFQNQGIAAPSPRPQPTLTPPGLRTTTPVAPTFVPTTSATTAP